MKLSILKVLMIQLHCIVLFNNVDVYFKSVNGNRYLIEKYEELWDTIREEIRLIKGGIEPFKYKKDVMKIKFESDNELSLNKILNIPVTVIIIGSVFEDIDGKFYPQIY